MDITAGSGSRSGPRPESRPHLWCRFPCARHFPFKNTPPVPDSEIAVQDFVSLGNLDEAFRALLAVKCVTPSKSVRVRIKGSPAIRLLDFRQLHRTQKTPRRPASVNKKHLIGTVHS